MDPADAARAPGPCSRARTPGTASEQIETIVRAAVLQAGAQVRLRCPDCRHQVFRIVGEGRVICLGCGIGLELRSAP